MCHMHFLGVNVIYHQVSIIEGRIRSCVPDMCSRKIRDCDL